MQQIGEELPCPPWRGGQSFGNAELLQGSKERSRRFEGHGLGRILGPGLTARLATHLQGHQHCSQTRTLQHNRMTRPLDGSPATQHLE